MKDESSVPRKMYLYEDGQHCFLIADKYVHYNYFNSDRVQTLPVLEQSGCSVTLNSFDCVKLFEESGHAYFEVCIGSQEGMIIYG